jgi:hypothetical protein
LEIAVRVLTAQLCILRGITFAFNKKVNLGSFVTEILPHFGSGLALSTLALESLFILAAFTFASGLLVGMFRCVGQVVGRHVDSK